MIKIIDVKQGSEEWHRHRATALNASDAPVMLGVSSYMKRSTLLRNKATGAAEDVDAATQERFDKGHEYEEMARPWAEEILGEDLYPIVLSREVDEITLSASFDGLTMLYDTCFEHKTLNAKLERALSGGEIPEEYWPQMEQQMMVSGAKRCLFMASSGSRESMRYAYYYGNQELRSKLVSGWNQFNKDLAAYKSAPVAPEVVASKPEQLPAITYQLNGLALTSNLDAFRAAADAAIEQSKKPLIDDQDFADREALCKAFVEAEKKLALVREQVVGEIHDVDQFCRGLAEIGELMRQARLAGEKQVKARKDEIRLEIRDAVLAAFAAHVQALNAELSGVLLPAFDTGRFAAAMKGKRTIATLQDAVDTELASMKIEADALAAKVRTNIQTLAEHGKGYEFLFNDRQDLCLREPDVVELMVKQRVADHKAEEQRKLEQERARIRKEEADRLEREAEQRRQQQEERERLAAEQRAKDEPQSVPVETLTAPAPAPAVANKLELLLDRLEREAEQRRQAEAQSAPVETPAASRIAVANKLELLKAVLAGEVPDDVLIVDLEALAHLCETQGRTFPGVIWA